MGNSAKIVDVPHYIRNMVKVLINMVGDLLSLIIGFAVKLEYNNMSRKSRTIKRFIRKMVYECSNDVLKRIEKDLCFKCGNVSKPTNISKQVWLCDKCEKEVMESAKTPPKPHKHTHYNTKRGWYTPGYSSSDNDDGKNTTTIDGKLFLDS